MTFRIADTFTDSLARLTGDEQKAVKTESLTRQSRNQERETPIIIRSDGRQTNTGQTAYGHKILHPLQTISLVRD